MLMIQNPKFWLLGIAGCLLALHLRVTWVVTESFDQITINLLFIIAALSLLWEKRYRLSLSSGLVSSISGALLIFWVLIRSAFLHSHTNMLVQIFPLASALGLALLASGFKGLKQYYREISIIALITLPIGTLSEMIDNLIQTSTLAAKFSTFVLWYLGFQVQRQGTKVILPRGAVDVHSACSGVNLMLLLLQLALLVILLRRIKIHQKILVPIIAVFIAFIVNGLRVTLMAFLEAYSTHASFEYWHGSEGAQIFTTTSILIFGLCSYFLLRESPKKPENQQDLPIKPIRS